MGSKLFFGGLPTAPDVDKLMRELGVPTPGLITHSTLEGILNLRRKENRYRTVICAWRKRLFQEHNVDMEAQAGEGYRVLTAIERLGYQGRQHRGAVRHAVKVHNRTVTIPTEELDDVSRRKYDHLLRATALLGSAALTSSTELRRALKAPEQLPKKQEAI